MPLRDWSLVPPGVFHAFHLAWIDSLQGLLNNDLLPDPFYALAEPIAGEAVPDVITLQVPAEPGGPRSPAQSDVTGLHDDSTDPAVALAPAPVIVKDFLLEPPVQGSGEA
jgi:hypothetical protein